MKYHSLKSFTESRLLVKDVGAIFKKWRSPPAADVTNFELKHSCWRCCYFRIVLLGATLSYEGGSSEAPGGRRLEVRLRETSALEAVTQFQQ